MAGCENGYIPNLPNSNTRVVYYNLSAWQDAISKQYGANGIEGSGCAIVSYAMAISYFTGMTVTPPDVMQKFELTYPRNGKYGGWNKFYDWTNGGNGTDAIGMALQSAYLWGLSSKQINKNDILSELKAGHLIIMSCQNTGYSKGHRLYWTSRYHIVLLSGYTTLSGNDLIYCHNCGKSALIGELYTLDEVASLVHNGWVSIWKNDVSTTALNRLAELTFKKGVEVANPSNATYTAAYPTTTTGNKNSSNFISSITNEIKSTLSNTASVLEKLTSTSTINFITYHTEYQTKSVLYYRDLIFYANQTLDIADNSLLSYPNLVESPFVQLKIGDYTFGTYKLVAGGVLYPNYILNLEVKKINGEVNLYTISLIHKIEAGTDPNFVDKILSSAGAGCKVYISYGDYNEPSFTYKEEEALLLKTTSTVDFKSSRISYTLSCTSNATALYARLYSFPASTDKKPSDIIKAMIYDNNDLYGLLSVFPAMKNKNFGYMCIASDDQEVEIPAVTSINPLAYINKLVTYMCSVTNTDSTEPLKDSTYKFCLYDSILDKDRYSRGLDSKENIYQTEGAYFKIIKLKVDDGANTLSNSNVYEIDVGYPTTGNVLDFLIKEDLSWAILYNYAGEVKETVYNIDKLGNLTSEYIPKIAMSTKLNKMTEYQKTWWTNMTEFPIHATLTLKGLITPIMLMDYVRINAIFYGLRHIASGLYVIESQTDTISSTGYRTKLELLRIAGDNAYIKKTLVTREVQVPVRVIDSTQAIATGIGALIGGVVGSVIGGVTGGIIESITSNINTRAATDSYNNDGSSTDAVNPSSLLNADLTNTNANITAKFLDSKGLSPAGVCGVLGNLQLESGIVPVRIQGDFTDGFKKSYEYTNKIDTGEISRDEFINNGPGGGGYGIAQWTYPSRKAKLYDLAKPAGWPPESIGNITIQNNYLWQELLGHPALLEILKTTTNVAYATERFCSIFENPKDSTANIPTRQSYALTFYDTLYK